MEPQMCCESVCMCMLGGCNTIAQNKESILVIKEEPNIDEFVYLKIDVCIQTSKFNLTWKTI